MKLNNKGLIVLHIHSLRRDYLANWLLSRLLEKKGFKVLLTSKASIRKLTYFITPDILVVPTMHILSRDSIRNLKKRGCKIIILEQEGTIDQIGVETAYIIKDKKDKYIDYSFFEAIYVWNEYACDWIKQNRKDINGKVYVSGNMRLDQNLNTVNQDVSNTIGIITRCEFINPFDGRNLLGHLFSYDLNLSNLANRYGIDRYSIDAEGFALTMQFAKAILSKGCKISIRPHPNEDITSYELIKKFLGDYSSNVDIDKSLSINEWLNKVYLVVGDTSSSYADIFNANKPIISLEAMKRHKMRYERGKVMDRFSKCAYHPKGIEEAINIALDPNLCLKESKEYNEFSDIFYSKLDKQTILYNIVEDISLIHKKTSDLKNNPSFLNSIFSFIILSTIDILVIIRFLLKKNGIKSLRRLLFYDYNSFIHRPSKFMKELDSKL